MVIYKTWVMKMLKPEIKNIDVMKVISSCVFGELGGGGGGNVWGFSFAGFPSLSWGRQPMVCPGLLKKLCPFVSVEGGLLPILDL
jgi:hypothetical protein